MNAEEISADTTDSVESEAKPKLTLDVKINQTGACQRHVTVTVARDDIERYFQDAYTDLQPKAEVPGFRPGRAPRKLVETRFKEQVADQVKGSLIMDSMTQITEDYEFSAISEPQFKLDAIEVPETGPLTFEFDIEVRPEFEMPQWRGLTLERPVRQYTEDDVQKEMHKILERFAEWVPGDGPVQLGDRVLLDVSFERDGETVSRLHDLTVRVKPKLSLRDATIENFGELVAGAVLGDRRETTLTITAEAENEALRGQEIKANFTIEGVSRLDLPKLTPGFLDRIGGFEDEDDVRRAVRGELERQFRYYQQRRIREQITRELTRNATWDLPPDLLKRQFRRELERAVLELRSAGFSDDVIQKHSNQLQQNSLVATRRALQEHFILERIAEDEKFEADPADYDQEIVLIAEQRNEPARRVRARLEKQGQMDTLRNQIIERKVIELICSHATFREVPFDPQPDDTTAIDEAVAPLPETEIPKATSPDEPEKLDHRP